MGSKIMKTGKFQNAVKNALVDEFQWNLCEMEALGSNFQDFFEFWIFVYFRMFYSYLNIGYIRIFGKSGKYLIWSVFEKKDEHFTLYFWNFFSRNFFFCPMPEKRWDWILHSYSRSKVTAPNVKSIFRFFGFWPKPYINP